MLYSCCYLCLYLFCFFKQKTAYEMRISDWSSDVCSSDLLVVGKKPLRYCRLRQRIAVDDKELARHLMARNPAAREIVGDGIKWVMQQPHPHRANAGLMHCLLNLIGCKARDDHDLFPATFPKGKRSEERRVGKELVRTCRCRWSSYN